MSLVRDSLYLAWCYLRHHRMKTLILVAAIATISFLPVGLNVLVAKSGEELMARAEATPLLIGARGSALELVLSALYFESDPPPPARQGEVDRILQSGLAEPIPLHVRFRVRDQPIVGTTLEYLDFRGLRVEAGRRMAVLGECVVGAWAARALGLAPGDSVVSSPERGRIAVDGTVMSELPDANRRAVRVRNIGLVIQEFALLDHLNVLDNVLLPYRITPALRLDTTARRRARSLIERVGLAESSDRLVTHLSQGERQRVAVCRALVTEPSLLLADEPTGNLDPANKFRVIDILRDYAGEHDATLLTVTHDHDLLGRFPRVIDIKSIHSEPTRGVPSS